MAVGASVMDARPKKCSPAGFHDDAARNAETVAGIQTYRARSAGAAVTWRLAARPHPRATRWEILEIRANRADGSWMTDRGVLGCQPRHNFPGWDIPNSLTGWSGMLIWLMGRL